MKKPIFIQFLFLLLLGSCTTGKTQLSNTSLSPSDFSNKIKEYPTAPIVDVRTPEEFSKGHLNNAINIDLKGNDFNNQISKLNKTNPVFIYCLIGGRSATAASQMRAKGFKEVYELDGGLMKWRAASLPEVKNNKLVEITKQQFDSLTNSDKLVLIDFYADWCMPCKKMEPHLTEISKEMAERVVLIRINADDNQQLCRELSIDALPTLQLFKNKKMVWSNIGYLTKERILDQLQ